MDDRHDEGDAGATGSALAVALAVMGASGRTVQVRKLRPENWTKAKRNGFLDHLAATSNVTLAAAAVGMSTASVYALRRRDPAFGELWGAALEEGYAHIEAQLLARTIGQQADSERSGDPSARAFDPEMAFRVLAARNGGAGSGKPRGPRGGDKRMPIAEVTATLKRMLDALARSLAKQQGSLAKQQGRG